MNELFPVVCPFCGVGCGMYLQLLDDGLVATLPSHSDPISEGRLCVRGWRAGELLVNSQRLTSPQVDGEATSWPEALERASQLLAGMAGSRVGILAAGHLSNEEGFAISYFGRKVLGTAHLDNFGRMIDGPALWGLEHSYGQAYRRPELNTLPDYDLLICLNSNLRELNDEAGAWVHKAREAGSKLIVIDAIDDGLGQDGQLYVQHRPGAQAAVLQELSRQLASETESLPSPDVAELGPAKLADQLREAADLIAAADRVAIVFSTRAVPSPELAVVAGDIAKQIGEADDQQAEVFTVAGTPNSLGLIHMGLLPGQPGGEGLGLDEMLGPEQEGLDGLIVIGEDLSAWIGEEALQALKDKLDALIVIDSLSTPCTRLADVALPTAGFGEREGSYTQLSGEVCWSGAAAAPAGEGHPLPEILAELAEGLDAAAGPTQTEAIWQQISAQISGYEQIQLAALRSEGRVTLGQTASLPQCGKVELDYQPPSRDEAKAGSYTLISRPDKNWWILDGRVPAIPALYREARDRQASYALMNPVDMEEAQVRPGRSASIETAQGSKELMIHEHPGVPTGYIVLPAHQLELIGRLMGPGQYDRESSGVSRAPVSAELKKG